MKANNPPSCKLCPPCFRVCTECHSTSSHDPGASLTPTQTCKKSFQKPPHVRFKPGHEASQLSPLQQSGDETDLKAEQCTITPAAPGAGSPCWDLKGQLFALVNIRRAWSVPPPHWSHLRNANRCCAFKNDTWSPDSWFGQKPRRQTRTWKAPRPHTAQGVTYMGLEGLKKCWFSWGLKGNFYPALGTALPSPPAWILKWLWGSLMGAGTVLPYSHRSISTVKTNKPQISSHLIWMRTQIGRNASITTPPEIKLQSWLPRMHLFS